MLRTVVLALGVLHAASMVAVAQDTSESRAVTKGVNHIGFAVKHLDATANFFTETLGWRVAGGNADYPAIFVSDGEIFVTLWQTQDDKPAVDFDRKHNVGLHHFAMTVPFMEDLEALHQKLLNTEGVTIEFAPELLGKGPTQHMMIREPSGLRLEFIVPGGKRKAD